MFEFLFKNYDKICVFDDCDSALLTRCDLVDIKVTRNKPIDFRVFIKAYKARFANLPNWKQMAFSNKPPDISKKSPPNFGGPFLFRF
jgi:hypothetical protein